ncbi:hypothetical protein [Capnocytophaga leadbetteri]
MSNFWLQNINIMRQVGGMRRLRRLGVVGRVRLVRRVRQVGVDRLGLDCKNVEKVRKLADKIPEKYNKVKNTIFDNISPEGIEYDKWKNSLEFIPNITHTETKTEF